MTGAADAAALLRYAWLPRRMPGGDVEYTRLVQRYLAEPVFQTMCEEIASGLGVFIVTVDPQAGIVAFAADGSPFALTVGDYSKRAAGSDPLWVIHGLAFVAAARLCFPQPVHLDAVDRQPRVSVADVDEYVRRLCARLDEDCRGHEVDPPADRPALERSWRAYQRRREAGRTGDARAHQTSTRRIVEKALEWLTEHGCLRPVPGVDGTFWATARFRVVVRELAGNDFYADVLAATARAEETAADDPSLGAGGEW
ncbi:MAG TPA: hypothetical protein VHL53_05130 [Acidimicrobiia bacterium]|nr:hypothetical protein [Acidimicrobiia bacterium]